MLIVIVIVIAIVIVIVQVQVHYVRSTNSFISTSHSSDLKLVLIVGALFMLQRDKLPFFHSKCVISCFLNTVICFVVLAATCVRPGGRPGPRRARRPPPCGVAAGLYLVLLFSLSVHFLLYSLIMASTL